MHPEPMPMSNPGRRKPKTLRWLLFLFLLLLVATTSATLGAITALIAPVEPELITKALDNFPSDANSNRPQYRLSRPVNILVMGIDRVPEAALNSADIFTGRGDTILLVRFDPSDKTVSVLSIPRDTQVEIPGLGTTKLTEANPKGGPALTARILSKTLAGAPIHRYVRVSSGAFQELVDLLGGVEVFVPQPMSYTDTTQRLNINLVQGWQTLNGEQADKFARFRNDGLGDIGRIQRQQTLMQALRKRLTRPEVVPRLPQLIRILQKYVDTDLNFEEILTLASFGLQLDRENLRLVMLPGEASEGEGDLRSYWIVDPAGRDRVMAQYFKMGSMDFTAAEGSARK